MEKSLNETEDGVEVPLERINPDTLHNMLADYVSREWSDLSDNNFTLDGKIEQVRQQLQDGRARVVFDLLSNSWNIVPFDTAVKEHVE